MKKTKSYLIKVVFMFLIPIYLWGCSMGSNYSIEEQNSGKENITIKFLSNLPERWSGQGKLEQLLIDKYMEENKNVTIEVEAYQDEPYKQRFKAYAISNDLPDIFFTWGQPSFFSPIMKGGYAAELNKDSFKETGFMEESLKGFSLNRKLYGVPKSSDYMVLYYNKALFEKYAIDVPNTFGQLIEVCNKLNKIGIIPISINAKDKWPLALLYQNLVLMEGGDQNLIYNAIKGDIKFSENVVLKKAAEDLKKLIEVNGKEEMISQEDFNASMNLFTQEKAAMYYMGSWEVGMENNPTLSDRFKQNIRVTNLPLSNGGGLVAWNGGGYAVSSKSEVKDEAIKLLEYMMKPENWSKMGWENGLIVPAQKNEDNRYKNESVLQKQIVNILNNAESQSGTPWYDSLTPNFKASIEDLSYQLALGGKNIEDFLLEVDKEIAKEKSES